MRAGPIILLLLLTLPPAAAPTAAAHGWMDDARRILDEHELLHGDLERAFVAAANEAEALDVQRRLEELDRDTELRILRAQREDLRRRGNARAAAALAAVIDAITAEPPRPVPR